MEIILNGIEVTILQDISRSGDSNSKHISAFDELRQAGLITLVHLWGKPKFKLTILGKKILQKHLPVIAKRVSKGEQGYFYTT